MNKLTQLLREQKKEFQKLAHAYQEVVQPPNCEEFGEGYWEGIKYGQSYIITAQQQLIDVVIEGIKSKIRPGASLVFDNFVARDNYFYNLALQTQITCLEEAKKNV